MMLGNEELSVVQDLPVQGTAVDCRGTAGTLKTGQLVGGASGSPTVCHHLVLGDLQKELVEGFVVFSETLLEKERKK